MPLTFSRRERHHVTPPNASDITSAGISPPANNAEIETPAVAPTVINTRLGGIVSDIAPDADKSAATSPGLAPRRFISGNKDGAMAAMSAAFDPEIPDTRSIAPNNTYDSPPRTRPSTELSAFSIAVAMPVSSRR